MILTLTLMLSAIALTACGGGGAGGGTAGQSPAASASCVPGDASTHDECGTVLIGFTDADGDFLNYTVDVVSLSLQTADGRVVEVLPRKTRVNFTDYVDLTELVSAAFVPPAIYVSGSIRLDYSAAEVFVAAGDSSKQAVVTDLDGSPVQQVDLKIQLSNRDQLLISKRRASLLQLDFDLEASHQVDIAPTPATAATELLIIAEVLPVDEKDFRVRGPLIEVNENAMNYVIALRPFNDRLGDFGKFSVNVTANTEFEVNGEMFVGAAGLRALGAAGPRTATIAAGSLALVNHSYTAQRVLAGSSVPGSDRDAVVGNIIKREGNFLTVRGATIIPWAGADRDAHFHDDVVVEIGPDTRVFRDGYRFSDLSIDALSPGQRVTILGTQPTPTTDALAPQILFDATQGAVRMHVTRVSGTVNAVQPGQTDITLYSIDRRPAAVFDFSGTGPSIDLDADPSNYEIATGNLVLADFAAGKPVTAYGFPSAFGMAPPDFSGRTMVDYTDVRSTLGISWGNSGTVAPFASIGSDGMVLALDNGDIGLRHHVKQGPVVIDLLALGSNTTITPRASGLMLFAIKSGDSLRQYSNFGDFVADLNASLNGATTARALYAHGRFDAGSNAFTAHAIAVFVLEPPM